MNNKNKISLSWSTKVLNIKITKTEIKKILKRNITITNKNDKSTKCNISKYYNTITTIIQNNNHIIINYAPYLKNGGGGEMEGACEFFFIKNKLHMITSRKGFSLLIFYWNRMFCWDISKNFSKKSNTYPRLKVDLKIFWKIYIFKEIKRTLGTFPEQILITITWINCFDCDFSNVSWCHFLIQA